MMIIIISAVFMVCVPLWGIHTCTYVLKTATARAAAAAYTSTATTAAAICTVRKAITPRGHGRGWALFNQIMHTRGDTDRQKGKQAGMKKYYMRVPKRSSLHQEVMR